MYGNPQRNLDSLYLKLFLSPFSVAGCLAFASCERPDGANGQTPGDSTGDSSEVVVESIELSPSSIELEMGGTVFIQAKELPVNAAGYVLDWKSSDNSVATVSDKGAVKALAVGIATITASAGHVSSSVEVTVLPNGDEPENPMEDPEPGDWFYSDGTWSTDLDSGKDVIGIVFWTGDPAGDDNLLRTEHPECSHGLVVAIQGDKYVPWQSAYAAYGKTVNEWIESNTSYEPIGTTSNGTNLYRMMGYNNTCAIKAFNAAPANAEWPVEAVEAVEAFEEACPSPSGTSGWYLPSIKEYVMMCYKDTDDYSGMSVLDGTETYDMLNKKLSEIPDAQPIGADGYGFYSSSTEEINANDRAYALSFCYKTLATNTKDNASLYSVRFILAF